MCLGVDRDGGGVVLEMPHVGHKTLFFGFVFHMKQPHPMLTS